MPERRGAFVPIDEAQSYITRTLVRLPQYVETDKILVNLSGLDRLCKLGGIKHLRIVTDDKGETSKAIPTIVGISKSGEAMAGKARITNLVPTYSANSENNKIKSGYGHDTKWIDTTIEVNTSEISQRIQGDNAWEHGVRNPKAWSFHLNRAIKGGVTKEGVRFLTIGLDAKDWTSVGIQYGIMTIFELIKKGGPSIGSAVSRVLIVSLMLNLFDFVMASNKSDYRFSFLYGPQIDRALLLYLTSLSTTLVRSGSQMK